MNCYFCKRKIPTIRLGKPTCGMYKCIIAFAKLSSEEREGLELKARKEAFAEKKQEEKSSYYPPLSEEKIKEISSKFNSNVEEEAKDVETEDGLILYGYKEPLVKVRGGYGYYGTISGTRDGEKIQCHICGVLCRQLGGAHLASHGRTTSEYREEFGIMKTTSLLSKNLIDEKSALVHEQIKRNPQTLSNLNYMQRMDKKARSNRMSQLRRGVSNMPLEKKISLGLAPINSLIK